jgi:hypothetical protein
MRHRAIRIAWVALGWCGATAYAQTVEVRRLGAPIATYGHEFTTIDGVRELSTGRVIALDSRDRAIHFIEAGLKAGRKIGRDGDGPGEFRLPTRIFAIGGDSSLVRDEARGSNYLLITGDGKTGPLIATKDSAYDAVRAGLAWATDARGGFYYGLMAATMFDSMTIMRWDRRQRRDSLGRYDPEPKSPLYTERPEVRKSPLGGFSYKPKNMPFKTYDQWAVAPDGRIAIVTSKPYRVTLRNANGSRVAGPVVPFTPIQVNDAEKAAYVKDLSKPMAGMWVERGSDKMVAAYRPPPAWLVKDLTPADWPTTLPPFLEDALRFASDGSLWVRRSVRTGTPVLHDVFDENAKLAYRIELPANRKVVGFGDGAVYLAHVDDDDLHYLEKYALPKR